MRRIVRDMYPKVKCIIGHSPVFANLQTNRRNKREQRGLPPAVMNMGDEHGSACHHEHGRTCKFGLLSPGNQVCSSQRGSLHSRDTVMASEELQQVEQNYMCDPEADGGFVYTTVEAAINWVHKYSLWPMPMGTSCCAIEYMAASCSRYDISRFGAEVNRYAPRQADFMFICGTITYKMALLVRRIWDQMPAPKWCIACGACACTGGMFRSYSVLQGVDKIVPVDVYISGCPPRPEALLQGLITLQDKIMATDHPLKDFFKTHDLREANNASTIKARMPLE